MRIVMVAARYLPFMGGIETHIHEVGKRLVEWGHSVVILTTDPQGRLSRRETVFGMNIIRVKAWPARQDYYFAPGVFSELAKLSADIVHIQGYHTLVPPVAMLACLRRRVPFVLTFHSGGHSSRVRNSIRGLQRRILRPLLIRASQLIGVSRFEAEFFSDALRVPQSRFVVVPNGAELPQATFASPPTEPTVLSVGRLERYKGHHRVIEAFPHFLKRCPNARLKILGSGPFEPELRDAAERSGVSARISIGVIPPGRREEMAGTIASAALVTLLSDYEAHPVAVLEALALKRPVLVGDTSGFKELAEDGLVRAIPLDSSRQAVAAAMYEQIMHPIQREIELPSWNDCAARLLDVYQSVIDRGRSYV